MRLGIGSVFCSLLLLLCMSPKAQADDKGQYLHWDFKIGGEERFRYEYKKDFDFNKSRKDTGSLMFNRERLNVQATLTDEYLNDWAQVFVEGLNAQTGGYRIKATANQTDDFDLHQAYVNLFNIGGSDVDVKLGRQEMKFGRGRLIAAPTWANRIRAFDAGILHYDHGGFYADAFYGQDVKYDDDKFNQSRNEEMLAGVYSGYQANKVAPLFEAYYLGLIDIKGNNDIHRYTVGGRVQAILAPGLVADVEVPIQFGKTGTLTGGVKTIKAWALHADLSQSFDEAFWKPKLAVAYDQASGDKDPNDSVSNTFTPLYQSTHEPYGLIDLVRWQNVRNPEVSVTFSPTEKFRFTPQMDFFWLESKSDSWYGSTGTATRTKTSGDRNYYLGSEASIRFYYDFTKNIKFETGYAHFFTGGYIKDTGADDDINWIYSQLTLKF